MEAVQEPDARKYVWTGAIPLQVHLHESEVTTLPAPPPVLGDIDLPAFPFAGNLVSPYVWFEIVDQHLCGHTGHLGGQVIYFREFHWNHHREFHCYEPLRPNGPADSLDCGSKVPHVRLMDSRIFLCGVTTTLLRKTSGDGQGKGVTEGVKWSHADLGRHSKRSRSDSIIALLVSVALCQMWMVEAQTKLYVSAVSSWMRCHACNRAQFEFEHS
eukprot:Gb_31522 [translate_table: standard]